MLVSQCQRASVPACQRPTRWMSGHVLVYQQHQNPFPRNDTIQTPSQSVDSLPEDGRCRDCVWIRHHHHRHRHVIITVTVYPQLSDHIDMRKLVICTWYGSRLGRRRRRRNRIFIGRCGNSTCVICRYVSYRLGSSSVTRWSFIRLHSLDQPDPAGG